MQLYHGTNSPNPLAIVSGKNQLDGETHAFGPGLYLTNSEADAARYGKVYRVKFKGKSILREGDRLLLPIIRRLVAESPDLEQRAWDWDMEGEGDKSRAIAAFMDVIKNYDDMPSALMTVHSDFYGEGNDAAWVQNISQFYDAYLVSFATLAAGAVTESDEDVIHLIVWDRSCLEIDPKPLSEAELKTAFKSAKPLLNVMPKAKIDHSRRVAKRLNDRGAHDLAVHGALYHDYLERGGKLDDLEAHVKELGLDPSTLRVIKALSDDEKNDPNASNGPLDHLRRVVPELADQHEKDAVLLIKLSDRIDNLWKRMKRDGKIGNGYKAKSMELYSFIADNYQGDPAPFRKLSGKFNRLITT